MNLAQTCLNLPIISLEREPARTRPNCPSCNNTQISVANSPKKCNIAPRSHRKVFCHRKAPRCGCAYVTVFVCCYNRYYRLPADCEPCLNLPIISYAVGRIGQDWARFTGNLPDPARVQECPNLTEPAHPLPPPFCAVRGLRLVTLAQWLRNRTSSGWGRPKAITPGARGRER